MPADGTHPKGGSKSKRGGGRGGAEKIGAGKGGAGKGGAGGRTDRVMKALGGFCGSCADRDRCPAFSGDGGEGGGSCHGAGVPELARGNLPYEHALPPGDRPFGAKLRELTIMALAGNANVGKSVIFNQLTGLSQTIGNWPGKTVQRAVGHLHHEGRRIRIIDLPGIYSLSTFSQEEEVTRDFIARRRPHVVVNVVDATNLERNLFFTLQLLELEAPQVIALNQMDLARKKGIIIDVEKLSEALGVPVVPTVAVKGEGVHDLVHAALSEADRHGRERRLRKRRADGGKGAPGKGDREGTTGGMGVGREPIRFGKVMEKRVAKLTAMIQKRAVPRDREGLGRYPARWLAIKGLEGDEKVLGALRGKDRKVDAAIVTLHHQIEEETDGSPSTAMSRERYAIAHGIWEGCTGIGKPRKKSPWQRFLEFTVHPVLGYLILIAIILGMFFIVMKVGGFFAGGLEDLLGLMAPEDPQGLEALLWNGVIFGFVAGIGIALPFLVPFFVIMAVMEDSGYLARVAFLMDSFMHRIGLHGKAIIPLILGYGCTVPAVLGTRIMETRRERFIAALLTTMVPCAARTVVIMGLVAVFVGFQWALALYAFNLLLILILGRVAYRVLPGEGIGLIMEMPPYRTPSAKVVLKQTWARLREFIVIAVPLIMVGSVILEGLRLMDWLDPLAGAMSPVTVWWLGLPAVAGVVLLFGILRKEMTLALLASMEGTSDFSKILTPVQMITFTIVVMFYVPCIATIAVLVKEFGWKHATAITVAEIVLALILGGVAFRVLSLVM